VICGTKSDCLDSHEILFDIDAKAEEIALAGCMQLAASTSAKSGEGVRQALHRLIQAIMESEEEWEAELLAAVQSASLDKPAEEDNGKTTLVEATDPCGTAFAVRPLEICLKKGLWHRALHVWLLDAATGRLLLRKYANDSAKSAGCWGPSCQAEIRADCEGDSVGGDLLSPELALETALRALHQQFGVSCPREDLEQWFSCKSRRDGCNELLDVFAVTLLDGELPTLQVPSGEAVLWVGHQDVFGPGRSSATPALRFNSEYCSSMVRRVCARMQHARFDPEGGL